MGLQLFLDAGWSIIDWIASRGLKVMLDLKFFDVPETVKGAVAQLSDRPVYMATVHGNASILRAAVHAKKNVKILAVTVLTSYTSERMRGRV